MNAFWISLLVLFPIIVIIVTLAMCKSASVADRKMDLLRAADYKTKPITSERCEFKGSSSEEQPSARFRHSGVQS